MDEMECVVYERILKGIKMAEIWGNSICILFVMKDLFRTVQEIYFGNTC